MPVSQRVQAGCWFGVALVCFLLIAFPAFTVLMPWTTAVTLAEATEEFPGQIDPNWPGVTVYHGRPHEWNFGTIGENPIGFVACAVILGLGVGGFIYCAHRSQRASAARPGEKGIVVSKS